MKQKKMKKKKSTGSFWFKFKDNKYGIVGLYIFLVIVFVALLAPVLAPYNPYESITATKDDVMASPSGDHWLGQDEAGRDILSLVI